MEVLEWNENEDGSEIMAVVEGELEGGEILRLHGRVYVGEIVSVSQGPDGQVTCEVRFTVVA